MTFKRGQTVKIIAGDYTGETVRIGGFDAEFLLVSLGVEFGHKVVRVNKSDCVAA